MPVRPFVEADIPPVVDLYWRFMRRRQGPAPLELRPLFHKLYFENPWIDGVQPSLVYEGKNGDLVGFLGVIARQMCLSGAPVRVAYGGNFIVNPSARATLAAQRLLGTYLKAKYDIWQTDSANDVSRLLLERMGFRTIPALNLHWIRPLRPASYAMFALSRANSSAFLTTIKTFSKPFSALFDLAATRISASPFSPKTPRLHGEELDLQTHYQCLLDFRNGYSMWADYDLDSLGWLLNFMNRGTIRGPLRKVLLRDDKGKIAGWYLYYLRPGSVSEVVQIGSSKRTTKDVLEHLFHDALQHGVIGLHGVVDRRSMADFSDRGCLFTCRGGWNVAFSRNPEILDVLERGDAFITRLDGEWCLDPGD